MMNNLLEDKDIVAKILNKLSKLCVIPNSGFLAGGAVANTLLNMKYGLPQLNFTHHYEQIN